MTGQTEPRLVDPTPFVPAQVSPAQSGPAQPGPAVDSDGHAETTAGSLLAGRYRLGIRVGSDAAAGAEFWRAEDTVLRRDVAATVLRRFGPGTDPDDDGGAVRAQEIIARALRSGRPGAPPSPSGCPASAWPTPSRTACSSPSPRRAPCSRWRRPPRPRTGTAMSWAATTPSGSG